MPDDDNQTGSDAIIARGMRAEKFLEEARFYFGKLREAYKESIARAFEGNVAADVTKYAAQLSVLADIEQQLETLSAEGSFEAHPE